jgi:hypothetical protein
LTSPDNTKINNPAAGTKLDPQIKMKKKTAKSKKSKKGRIWYLSNDKNTSST